MSNHDVLCIEAGGSGQVHLNNFDHHNLVLSGVEGEGGHLPASCEQAFEVKHKTGTGTGLTGARNGVRVDHLLPYLNALEPGWGGRETIIGSPRIGSRLEPAMIRRLVAG